MKTVLAGDLGGTKCRFALVAEDWSVHAVQQVETSRDRAVFLARFDAAITATLAAVPPGWPAPRCAGVGTAGVIPPGGRSIHHAPNVPLDGFALADHVEARFGLPTTLLNDGRASALGEYSRGRARGLDPLLCLYFGTGIGIGLIVDGRPYGGYANAAGEIGHTIHVPGGRRCPCGALGHFEAYCGGRAITERAAAELGQAPGGRPWTVGAVVQHPAGAAAAILREAAAAATAVVANACTLLNPRAVVLGGGVLDGWPALFDEIVAFVRAQCSEPIWRGVAFVPSMAGSDAILFGAAAAAGALSGK